MVMESMYEYARESFFLLVGPEPTFVTELEIFAQSIWQWIW
jgi:hypothetical protein